MSNSDLFSTAWMQGFEHAWNAEPSVVEPLARLGFNASIGYGFIDQDQPSLVAHIQGGHIHSVAPPSGERMDWDLRASRDTWEGWRKSPPGMMALGMAYTTGKLRFVKGDYLAMLKNPDMAAPFVRSFGVMSSVA